MSRQRLAPRRAHGILFLSRQAPSQQQIREFAQPISRITPTHANNNQSMGGISRTIRSRKSSTRAPRPAFSFG